MAQSKAMGTKWAWRMAMAAGLAGGLVGGLAAVGGCSSSPPRTGSPIADRSKPRVVQPGSPAVAADGEVFGGDKPAPVRTAATAPAPRVTTSAAAAPAAAQGDRPAPAIDLDEAPAAKPAATSAAAPAKPAATATKPVPAREPVVDLDETKVTKPAPAPAREPVTNSGPKPAAAPARVEATAQPVTPPTGDMGTLSGVTEYAMALIEELSRSEQPDVRANCVEAAGMVPKRLEAVIVSGLSDRNEGVQAVAAMTIGRQRLASLAPRTRALLSNPSAYVETAAIMALTRNGEVIDDAKMSRLGELLFMSQSPRVRAHVAFLVGEIGNDSALPMLKAAADVKMPLAAQGEFNSMMLQFAEAMFKLGDTNQIEAIRAALTPGRPDDLEATAAAAQILGELGDKKPIDQMVYLTAYRDPTTKQLYPAEVRMQIASSLGKLGLDRGGFIADEFLKNEDPALRAQAAAVYGDTGRPEHLSKLVELLKDPQEQVRITAAGAVLKIAKRSGVLAK
jgi:HEAT repeat protein